MMLSDPHETRGGSPPPGGFLSLRYVLTEKELADAIRQFTGTEPKKSTVHDVMRFLDWAIGKIRKGTFEASKDIADCYLTRLKDRDGKTVRLLPFLCRILVLKKAAGHSKRNHIAIRYRFLRKPSRKRITISPTPQTLQKIRDHGKRARRIKEQDKEASWVEESILNSEVPQEVLDSLGSNHRGTLNTINSKSWSVKKSGGRLTTPYSNLPESARERISIQGEQVSRLDINASHLVMLAAEIQRRCDDFFEEPRRSRILEELAEYRSALGRGKDAYLELFPDFHKDLRNRTKKDVQTFLNGKDGRYSRLLARAFRSRFPSIAAVVMGQNKSGKALGPFLQSIENRVIRKAINSLRKKGIHCIPDVDEIIVAWSHRQDAIDALGKAIYELCGVCALISGVRYIPPQAGIEREIEPNEESGHTVPVLESSPPKEVLPEAAKIETDAFRSGFDAAWDGYEYFENAYEMERGSSRWFEWRDGYKAGILDIAEHRVEYSAVEKEVSHCIAFESEVVRDGRRSITTNECDNLKHFSHI